MSDLGQLVKCPCYCFLSHNGVANEGWSSRKPIFDRAKWTLFFVKRLVALAKIYDCHICGASHFHFDKLAIYRCTPSDGFKILFRGGFFSPPQTVYDIVIESSGIEKKRSIRVSYYIEI